MTCTATTEPTRVEFAWRLLKWVESPDADNEALMLVASSAYVNALRGHAL